MQIQSIAIFQFEYLRHNHSPMVRSGARKTTDGAGGTAAAGTLIISCSDRGTVCSDASFSSCHRVCFGCLPSTCVPPAAHTHTPCSHPLFLNSKNTAQTWSSSLVHPQGYMSPLVFFTVKSNYVEKGVKNQHPASCQVLF